MLQLSIYKGMAGRVALIGALLVGAVAVFLMTGGPGEGQERCPAGVAAGTVCIEYPEGGAGGVIAYTAVDPEEKDVIWEHPTDGTILAGTDADDFEIDGGRLTFRVTPDFENPMGGTVAPFTNVYNVTIQATDEDAGLADVDATFREAPRPVTRVLRITVTNVDEEGEITLPTLQPQVDVEIAATLEDADGVPDSDPFTTVFTATATAANIKWQWSRSSRATGGWTDIQDDESTMDVMEGKTSSYTPTKDDVGMYLRATVTYDDGHGTGKTAEAISANPVQADPRNKRPEFLDENEEELTSTDRSVAENSDAGTAVGAPVTATDPGFDGRQETLTYSLSGNDDDSDFDIDSGTGQIRVKAALDFEDTTAENPRTVTVQATDPSSLMRTVTVKIAVTDVDEAPTITGGDSSVDYNEDNDPGTEVAAYAAADPDGDNAASLKWSLSGRDAGAFAIGNREVDRGRLTFREAPDYEAPTDSGRDNVYEVTVEVADKGGNKASRDVTVNVENVDERGLLTVSSLNPRVGVRITPTLTDPDTPISNVIWKWSVQGQEVSIANAYTPRSADEGDTLELSVSYTDGTGQRRTEEITSLEFDDIEAQGIGNQSPRFPASAPPTLTVSEDATPGDDVGEVIATDPDADDLTYSLSGGDSAFRIDQKTGEITTRVELDREKRSSYRVTITAEDSSGARDSHSLTIMVSDVNEAPTITSGDSYVYYEENDRRSVAVYTASDPERDSIAWTLSGPDADAFTLVRGVLKFSSPPDYENDDHDPEYTVIVNAGDGHAGNIDFEEVTIEIVNVDERGTLTLSSLRPRARTEVVATPMDDDGDITGQSWRWAIATSRNGRFIDIEDATSATYTLDDADAGKYLRATLTYTDGHGEGKSASVTSQQTLWAESGPPVFLDDDGDPLPTTEPSTGMFDTAGPVNRNIAENAASRARVGAPVAARDIGNNGRPETLRYTLVTTGTDADDDNAKFDISRWTGQISVKPGVTLNFEAPAEADDNCTARNTCRVAVRATDPSGNTNTVPVVIQITNVDEPPVFDSDLTTADVIDAPPTALSVAENTEAIDADPGTPDTVDPASYSARNPEETTVQAGSIAYTLAGTDADDFSISAVGVLAFKDPPDYEARQNKVYDVTVEAADVAGNTTSLRVRITVTNVDEDGEISLSHTQPVVGISLTAKLTDPDRTRGRINWQWYRGDADANDDDVVDTDATESCSADDASDVCAIDRAIRATYSPVAADTGMLTLVARYTDYQSAGSNDNDKVAIATTPVAVLAERIDATPQFGATSYERTVREDVALDDTGEDRFVGGAVKAAYADEVARADETLFHTLSGHDARLFTIDPTTGQISVAPGVELDHEDEDSYRVTVKAETPSRRSDTVEVNISVLDVDELPELTRKGLVAVGSDYISYAENGRDRVAEYSAIGPNAGSVSWRLTGRDASDFTISSRGVLSFRSTPNFESPADADRDNRYEFTVTARAGRGDDDSFDVIVDVYNVDEEGQVTISPTRGNIGTRLSAEVTDPDGAVAVVRWEWSRSENGETGWTPIAGTNSDSLVIEIEDRGYYLQATAYYSDPQGGGKSASGRTAGPVLRDDDGRVTLTPAEAQAGDRVSATLTDPDGNIRNREWQWARSESRTSGWSDIPGATQSTYTTGTLDVGNFLRVTVRYDDGDGPDKIAEAVSSVAVAEDDDGSVTLSSTSPTVGETVTATLTDPDGGVTRASWQWASSSTGTSGWTDISGATSRTYTVAAGVLNRYLRATVVYDDAAGAGKSAQVVTAAAVAEDDDGSVALSPASPSDGDRVTATLTDPDGGVRGETWQWARSTNRTTWTDIANATSAAYTPVTADVGSYLRATVTYTDAVGPGKSAEAVTAAAVTADDDGSVALSNTTPTDGETVTATLTDPDGRVSGVTWQWAISRDRTTWTVILNATSSSYTATTANVGSYLRASVSYTDAVGPDKSASAVTVAAVAPDDDGVVTLSTRAPEVGSAITASLSDPDGGVTGATWQWAKSSNGATGWTDIQGATSASYTPGRSDAGVFLRATVSYNDAVGPGKSAQAATSSGVVQAALLSEYDANRDGRIERSEAIDAVSDFFNGEISKGDVLDVLVLYFSS